MVSRKKLRRRDMGWADNQPSRQEPAPDPGKTGHKGKDTKRWCRGVVGREHVLETVIPENTHNLSKGCQLIDRRNWHRWRNWKLWGYWCDHVIRCQVCRKVLEHNLGEKCPDFPGWPEEEA